VADFLEHRIYVPLMGLLIVFSEISFVKNLDLNKKLTKTVLLAIFVLLVVINFIHNNNFKDKIAFWENAVKYSPSHPLSHKNLGAMYYLDGNLGAAKIEFEKSVAINPTEAMIHNNLGLIYYREGNYEKAEEEYFRELELYPNYDNAYMNLGLLYYQEGDKDKAAEMWFKTIQVNPDHKDALKSLTIYYSQDKKDQAKANYYYQEAVKRGVKF
jgi:Tfp pilus assembly protein PilF